MESTPVVIAILCLASVVLALALFLLLTPRNSGGERYTDADAASPEIMWAESDPGLNPSPLVTNIVLDLMRTADAAAPQVKRSHAHAHADRVMPPSVRLERSWARPDGTQMWQVRVCRINLCNVDFGTQCERIVVSGTAVASASASGSWRIVRREQIPSVSRGGVGGPSSDALLLPGFQF